MDWSKRKNALNIKKHGISFDEAQEVFNDPNALEYYDEAHSSVDEQRYVCIGDIGGMVIVYVVFQDKRGTTRIISARPAEPIERRYYYEHLKRATGGN